MSETQDERSGDGKRSPSVLSPAGDDAGGEEAGEEAEGEQGGHEGRERHAGGECWTGGGRVRGVGEYEKGRGTHR
jgi:hypothetical protein